MVACGGPQVCFNVSVALFFQTLEATTQVLVTPWGEEHFLSGMEDKIIEITPSEQQKEKQILKNGKSF